MAAKCFLLIISFLTVLLAKSLHAQDPVKPGCMQAWLAKAGIPQPDIRFYEQRLLGKSISVAYLSKLDQASGVEAILSFAGIRNRTHRRLIALCFLNKTAACSTPTCFHGGVCQPGPTQSMASGPARYVCHCPSGFEGDRCELEACGPSSCQNGGSCSGPSRKLVCHCPDEWKGSRCQTPKNECMSHPCQNGGSCVNQTDGYQCRCAQGFSGTTCNMQTGQSAPGTVAAAVNTQTLQLARLNGSLAALQKEVGELRSKVSSVDAWIRRLWCSGGDVKNSKYGFHEGCHYCFYRKKRNFKDAMNRCRMRGGDLISVHSRDEELFSLLRFGGGFWLGGHDKFVEGLWQWTDGSPFKYANWMPGQPSNTRGREHCAAGFGAGWSDDACKLKRSYICKICPQRTR